MSASEKARKNSRWTDASSNPHDQYDRAEREGLQPAYATDMELPERIGKDAGAAVVNLIKRIEGEDDALAVEKLSRAVVNLAGLAGRKSGGSGTGKPTNAIQINVGQRPPAVDFPDGCDV